MHLILHIVVMNLLADDIELNQGLEILIFFSCKSVYNRPFHLPSLRNIIFHRSQVILLKVSQNSFASLLISQENTEFSEPLTNLSAFSLP